MAAPVPVAVARRAGEAAKLALRLLVRPGVPTETSDAAMICR